MSYKLPITFTFGFSIFEENRNLKYEWNFFLMISQHFLIYVVVVKTWNIFVYRVPILEGQLVSWDQNFYGTSLIFSGKFFSSNVWMITVLTLAILIVDHFTWNWKSYIVIVIIQKNLEQKQDGPYFQMIHFCQLGSIRGRFHKAGHTK